MTKTYSIYPFDLSLKKTEDLEQLLRETKWAIDGLKGFFPPADDFYTNLIQNRIFDEDGKIDLQKVANHRLYLALKKLKRENFSIFYGNNEKTYFPTLKVYDERTPILGSQAEDFYRLQQTYGADIHFITLTQDLYSAPSVYTLNDMLPEEHFNPIIDKLNEEKVKSLLSKLENDLVIVENIPYAGRIVRGFTEKGHFFSQIFVKPISCFESAVLLHETQHLFETFPGENPSQRKEQPSLIELTPVLQEILLVDTVFKKKNGIPMQEIVNYSPLMVQDKSYHLGYLANQLRKLEESYPNLSLSAQLMTPQGIELVYQLTPHAKKRFGLETGSLKQGNSQLQILELDKLLEAHPDLNCPVKPQKISKQVEKNQRTIG